MPTHDDDAERIDQQDLPPYERDGYRVLDEFDDSDPAAGDRLVLEQLVSHGADLTKSRHVVHYFYFPAEDARARAEIRLRGAGYDTRIGVDVNGDLPLSLIAERTGIVNDEFLSKERNLLTTIADAEDGEYDGWEAALD